MLAANDHHPDWFRVSPLFRPKLVSYWRDGRVPADAFLFAVLSNNLREAVIAANDTQRRDAIFHLPAFLIAEFPPLCWGSSEAVANWHYVGGHEGRVSVLSEFAQHMTGPRQ